MKLLGLIPEPPFDPRSWSGSSVHFFRALQRIDLLADACHVAVTPLTDLRQKALAFGWPLPRWREQYHSSVARFRSLTRAVATEIARHPEADAILQIGAWFSAPVVNLTTLLQLS